MVTMVMMPKSMKLDHSMACESARSAQVRPTINAVISVKRMAGLALRMGWRLLMAQMLALKW